MHCSFMYYLARDSSIYQARFSTTNTIFENFDEIATTSVDERKLYR